MDFIQTLAPIQNYWRPDQLWSKGGVIRLF